MSWLWGGNSNDPIGKGGEGVVYKMHKQDTVAKVRRLVDGKPVESKQLNKIRNLPVQQRKKGHQIVMKKDTPKLVEEEVEYLLTNQAHHINPSYFPEVKGIDPKTGTIYMQYLKKPWVTLDKYSKTLVPDRLEMFGKMMCHLAGAVQSLHDHGIAHLDIKPENIFVNPNTGGIRLMDFGVACDRNGKFRKCTVDGGHTRIYMPPQFFDTHRPKPHDSDIFPYLTRRDLFELGVTIYESLHGKRPGQWVKDFEKNYIDPTQKEIPGLTSEDLRRRGVQENRVKEMLTKREAFQQAVKTCTALVEWDKNLLAKDMSKRRMQKKTDTTRPQRTGE